MAVWLGMRETAVGLMSMLPAAVNEPTPLVVVFDATTERNVLVTLAGTVIIAVVELGTASTVATTVLPSNKLKVT